MNDSESSGACLSSTASTTARVIMSGMCWRQPMTGANSNTWDDCSSACFTTSANRLGVRSDSGVSDSWRQGNSSSPAKTRDSSLVQCDVLRGSHVRKKSGDSGHSEQASCPRERPKASLQSVTRAQTPKLITFHRCRLSGGASQYDFEVQPFGRSRLGCAQDPIRTQPTRATDASIVGRITCYRLVGIWFTK